MTALRTSRRPSGPGTTDVNSASRSGSTPLGAFSLLGVLLHELGNRAVELSELFGRECRSLRRTSGPLEPIAALFKATLDQPSSR